MAHNLRKGCPEDAQRRVRFGRNCGNRITHTNDDLKDDNEEYEQQLACLPHAEEKHYNGQQRDLRYGIGHV